jgi:hypothetical protein
MDTQRTSGRTNTQGGSAPAASRAPTVPPPIPAAARARGSSPQVTSDVDAPSPVALSAPSSPGPTMSPVTYSGFPSSEPTLPGSEPTHVGTGTNPGTHVLAVSGNTDQIPQFDAQELFGRRRGRAHGRAGRPVRPARPLHRAARPDRHAAGDVRQDRLDPHRQPGRPDRRAWHGQEPPPGRAHQPGQGRGARPARDRWRRRRGRHPVRADGAGAVGPVRLRRRRARGREPRSHPGRGGRGPARDPGARGGAPPGVHAARAVRAEPGGRAAGRVAAAPRVAHLHGGAAVPGRPGRAQAAAHLRREPRGLWPGDHQPGAVPGGRHGQPAGDGGGHRHRRAVREGAGLRRGRRGAAAARPRRAVARRERGHPARAAAPARRHPARAHHPRPRGRRHPALPARDRAPPARERERGARWRRAVADRSGPAGPRPSCRARTSSSSPPAWR